MRKEEKVLCFLREYEEWLRKYADDSFGHCDHDERCHCEEEAEVTMKIHDLNVLILELGY